MLDWQSFFPYVLIGTVCLFALGLYAIISAKRFLKVIFGVALMLMSANLLLLSFGGRAEGGEFTADPFAQTLALVIVILGAVFIAIGVAIDKQLRKTTGSTDIPLKDAFFSRVHKKKTNKMALDLVAEGIDKKVKD